MRLRCTGSDLEGQTCLAYYCVHACVGRGHTIQQRPPIAKAGAAALGSRMLAKRLWPVDMKQPLRMTWFVMRTYLRRLATKVGVTSQGLDSQALLLVCFLPAEQDANSIHADTLSATPFLPRASASRQGCQETLPAISQSRASDSSCHIYTTHHSNGHGSHQTRCHRYQRWLQRSSLDTRCIPTTSINQRHQVNTACLDLVNKRVSDSDLWQRVEEENDHRLKQCLRRASVRCHLP